MRLYLSSFRLGDHPEKLAELVERKTAAIVCNACDLYPAEDRADQVEFEKEALKSIGLSADELDLRCFFDPTTHEDLKNLLSGYGMVWVKGGNSFVLRRAMRYSGFDDLIRTLLLGDEIVYAGYSAGVCVLAPSLQGLELVDDPDSVPDGYDPSIIWDSLGLLPYAVAPHFRSNHPESEAIEELVNYYLDKKVPHKTLRDGQAIIVDGDLVELVG